MQKRIFTIIIILVLFGLSFVAGYWFKGTTPTSTLSEESNRFDELRKSKLIQDWIITVSGEITVISGRTLTLTSEGESLVIFIKEDAKILSIVLLEQTEEKEIQFIDLKVGDNVTAVMKVQENGELKGIHVAIFQ